MFKFASGFITGTAVGVVLVVRFKPHVLYHAEILLAKMDLIHYNQTGQIGGKQNTRKENNV